MVFYLGLTAAVATVETVRVELMQFFVRIDGGQASFGFEISDSQLEVPSGWSGCYYPTWIPDGYVLTGVFDDSVVYQNRAGPSFASATAARTRAGRSTPKTRRSNP